VLGTKREFLQRVHGRTVGIPYARLFDQEESVPFESFTSCGLGPRIVCTK
jgi:hypothetical protein